MGDRATVTLYHPELDRISAKRRRSLLGVTDALMDLGMPDHGFDTLSTDPWSSGTWQWHDVLLGAVYGLTETGFEEIVDLFIKWNINPEGLKVWQDPKYEYLGSIMTFATNGQVISGDCDSQGNLLLSEDLFSPSMLDAEIAAIVRKKLGLPDWIDALDLAGVPEKNVTLTPTTTEGAA